MLVNTVESIGKFHRQQHLSDFGRTVKEDFALPLVAPFSSLPSAVQQYIHGIFLTAAGLH